MFKNDSFTSNSKCQNSKKFLKKKVLTFESAFIKKNNNNKNLNIPQILPNSIQVGNSLNFNEFSNKIPINININNYNINNYNILKNDRGDNASSLNYLNKNYSSYGFNNLINNNISTGIEKNHNNFMLQEHTLSRKLSNLNNSNDVKSKNKYFPSNKIQLK